MNTARRNARSKALVRANLTASLLVAMGLAPSIAMAQDCATATPGLWTLAPMWTLWTADQRPPLRGVRVARPQRPQRLGQRFALPTAPTGLDDEGPLSNNQIAVSHVPGLNCQPCPRLRHLVKREVSVGRSLRGQRHSWLDPRGRGLCRDPV